MQLEPYELHLFYKLLGSLMFFVNERLEIVKGIFGGPEAYPEIPPETRIKIREALLANRDLIEEFASANPFWLSEGELEIVRSWKHLVAGEFYLYRCLRKHAIFLTHHEPAVAYGVLSLASTFEELLGHRLPHLCKAVLLPFRGRIVYDGVLAGYNVTFGPGIRRRLKLSYDSAKMWPGIITTLPPSHQSPGPAPAKTPTKRKSAGAPKSATGASSSRHQVDEIIALTDAFCRENTDDEYAALCRKLAELLARKRPSPLTRGKPESWASGIARVIGWVNFIGDPSQPHHMRLSDIDRKFGVSEATGTAKSLAIRKLLDINRLDTEWSLRGLTDQNPLAWLIEVDGLMVDARHLPREIQEVAYRKGVIPYIPGEKP